MSVVVLDRLLGRTGEPIDDASSERRLIGFVWFEGTSEGMFPRSSSIDGELVKGGRDEPGSGELGSGELGSGELGSGELGRRPLVVGRGGVSRRGGGSARDVAARF